jgi:2,3-bisphosphoglycerate-dependent phosphoglycerate mutase
VFVRHGESTWNFDNRFTGWVDVGLTEKGVNEAKSAGQILKRDGYEFDVVFTSFLKRSIVTFNLIAEEMGQHHIEV